MLMSINKKNKSKKTAIKKIFKSILKIYFSESYNKTGISPLIYKVT